LPAVANQRNKKYDYFILPRIFVSDPKLDATAVPDAVDLAKEFLASAIADEALRRTLPMGSTS
jgi:hypothetical protein